MYYNERMDRKTQAPVSTRYPSDTLKRLDRRARTEGHSRSMLIQRYVAEGIEMDEHPGIVFRSGPAGRRPGLVSGADVWEVVAVHRSFDDVERTASRSAMIVVSRLRHGWTTSCSVRPQSRPPRSRTRSPSSPYHPNSPGSGRGYSHESPKIRT